MRSHSTTSALAALFTAAILTGPAAAVVTTVGCADAGVSCTLEELALGAVMNVGGLELSDWLVDDASAVPIQAAAIDVVALDLPSARGVSIDAGGAIVATGFDLVDLVLRFTVAASAGVAWIGGSSIAIDTFGFDAGNVGGYVAVFEDVFAESGTLLGASFVTADNLAPETFALLDAAAFAPTRQIDVQSTVLAAGDGPVDEVSLGRFTLLFSPASVPEPSTVMLLAIAAIGCAAGMSHRRRCRG